MTHTIEICASSFQPPMSGPDSQWCVTHRHSTGPCKFKTYAEVPEPPRPLYVIPEGERYFLDADGYCWREVAFDGSYGAFHDGQVMHSMARTNPDNSPTPEPYLYLVPERDDIDFDEYVKAATQDLQQENKQLRQALDAAGVPQCPRHGYPPYQGIDWAEHQAHCNPGLAVHPVRQCAYTPPNALRSRCQRNTTNATGYCDFHTPSGDYLLTDRSGPASGSDLKAGASGG